MLTLWYTVLSYKEYKDSIWEKLTSKKGPGPKETAIVCPLPPKKAEPPSRIPLIDPPKSPRTPSPQIPVSPPSPQPPPPKPLVIPQKPPTPEPSLTPPAPPKSPENPTPVSQKMEPPPKPPRSPSPHPIKALDDIEYEEEESEESSEGEEEDSVLATPQRRPVAKNVNDFLEREKMT